MTIDNNKEDLRRKSYHHLSQIHKSPRDEGAKKIRNSDQVQQPADLSQIDKSTRDEGARKIRNSDQVQQPAEKSLRLALIVQLVKEQGVLIKKKKFLW